MHKEKIDTVKSLLPYSYDTIKVTKSRLDKGLLAIPVTLIDKFPSKKSTIKVYLNYGNILFEKNFTPYDSSSRECRIGGMRQFFISNKVQPGDELVILFKDYQTYRILTEEKYVNKLNLLEQNLESIKKDHLFYPSLKRIVTYTNESIDKIIYSEYFRLTQGKMKKRKHKIKRSSTSKENVPIFIRNILSELYKGKCQITGFGFNTKTGKPFFEIHHINSELGNHPKNLLVVSPNVHSQFTYARVKEYFDKDGWLRRVKFNDSPHFVYQMIDKIPKIYKKMVHQ